MPLTPAATDRFQKVGNPGSATTLASPGYAQGNTSISVGSTTNHPTDTLYTFAMDRAQVVNGVETRIAGTYNEFEGIVTGANTIGSVKKVFGNGQDYAAGALTRVYIPVTGNRENALIDGLNQDHNGKGNHKTLTDDNANEWLERGQVASAVNQVKVTNAATGAPPVISANGDDTNIDIQMNPKGAGVAKVDGSAPRQFFALFNFVESGCVWSGTGYGSTLIASMTAGFVWINGKRLTVAAVTNRAFTASKDTYVDLQDNGDSTAKIVYTEVTNNAASPIIPNSLTDTTNVRNAIIITGATNIAGAGSVNQGQYTAILPSSGGIAYTFTDSLGYIIQPRDPNRKVIGYRQVISTQSGITSTIVDLAGASASVIVPTGRNIKLTGNILFSSSSAPTNAVILWAEDGVNFAINATPIANTSNGFNNNGIATRTPTAGFHTYKMQVQVNAGSGTSNAGSGGSNGNSPAFILIELE